jgi:protocatechuate 3,4-dioxygenase beta subunit
VRHVTRLVAVVVCCGVSWVPIAAQTVGFIVAEYLAPQFTAPVNAPSDGVIAGRDEPGERLVVTGRALDGATPVAGVSLYVFHTDAKGRYAIDGSSPQIAELNPRLHTSLRTDRQGRYRYETIRPGSYGTPPGASHVHYVVKAAGYQPLLLALQFQDDPIVQRMAKAGTPVLNPDAFKNGPCKSRPDCVLTQPVRRDVQGVSHVIRDIQMVKQ